MITKTLMLTAVVLAVGLIIINHLSVERSQRKKDEQDQTYFIQLETDSSGISQIRQEIKPIITKIMREELGIKSVEQLFLGKDRQAITLYYVQGMHENNEQTLIAALDAVQIKTPTSIFVKPQVNFFGEWQDELVIMIHDQELELAKLNSAVKAVLHDAQNSYLTEKGHPLFDIAKSEHFSYVPHIGLGRIRSNSIKQQVKNTAEAEKVLERIKERVKQETLQIADRLLTSETSKILCKKTSIFALPKRVVIKEYFLES